MIYKVLAAPLGRIVHPSPLSGVLLQGPASPANLGIEMASSKPLAGSSVGTDLGSVTEAQASAIGAKIDVALAAINEKMAGMLTSGQLPPSENRNVPPDMTHFSDGQLFSFLVMYAQALMDTANSFANGVAGTYFLMPQQEKLGEINGLGQEAVNSASASAEPLVENSEEWNVAQAFMEKDMASIKDLVGQAEREIVSAESGGIGVRESSEKTRDFLIGGGILAAAGVLGVILLS